MKKLLVVVPLALLLLTVPFLATNCGQNGKNPITPTVGSDSTAHSGNAGNDPKRTFPNYCFQINVPWMPQVPPGDWGSTNNCGQAICVMLGAKFNNGALAPWVIDGENQWLGCPTPNGCLTGASTLQRLLLGFHNLHSTVYRGYYADDVVMEGANGRPVIVAVRTHMQLSGRPHWMLFTGWDGTYMYFNDPGRSLISDGRCKYLVTDFMTCWNDQGRIYIPVYR